MSVNTMRRLQANLSMFAVAGVLAAAALMSSSSGRPMLLKIGSKCLTTSSSPPIIRQKPRSNPNTPPLVPQST